MITGAHTILYARDADAARAFFRDVARGVTFSTAVSDEGWGLRTLMDVPGFGTVGLYEPRHPTAVER